MTIGKVLGNVAGVVALGGVVVGFGAALGGYEAVVASANEPVAVNMCKESWKDGALETAALKWRPIPDSSGAYVTCRPSSVGGYKTIDVTIGVNHMRFRAPRYVPALDITLG